MKKFKDIMVLVSWLGVTFLTACHKEDSTGNSLGGSTDITLTKPGSVSTVWGSYGTQSLSNASLTVVSNDNGRVKYRATLDISQYPDSLKLKAATLAVQIAEYYKLDSGAFVLGPNNILQFDFDLRITSEGYLDYFTEGKPWIVGRYGDGVGTEYKLVNDKGEEQVRTVTEKTGQDDWPLTPFLYIKTSEITQYMLSDNPVFEKVIFRMNHRFGLVYAEYFLRDGTTLKLGIFASFV